MAHQQNALVIGGFGAIGAAVTASLERHGFHVLRASRSAGTSDDERIRVDPFTPGGDGLRALDNLGPLDAVVWAQGANRADSLDAFDLESFEEMLRANCTFVAATLARLLARERLATGARLCVVSSIWQTSARQEKLSYTVSKAALGGLVRSAAVDLAPRGILINAVLPGVVETPMTRAMLTPEQLATVSSATGFDRLVSVEDVAALVCHLSSPANTGVTGQSIAVDLGFSVGRRV